MSNNIPKATALAVKKLVRAGASTRQIVAQTGVAKATALRFRQAVLTGKKVSQAKPKPTPPADPVAALPVDDIGACWPAPMGRESQAWRNGE